MAPSLERRAASYKRKQENRGSTFADFIRVAGVDPWGAPRAPLIRLV